MSWLSRMFRPAAHTYMTPAELRSARATLETTTDRFASELHLLRYELEEMESGARAVTPGVAYEVRVALVNHARARLAAECALPRCDDGLRLHARVERAQRKLAERGVAGDADEVAKDFSIRYTTAAVAEHEKSCATCRARNEFLLRHAPPMPLRPAFLYEAPASGLLGPLAAMARRLPAFLQPAPGNAGAGRRAAAGYAILIAFVGSCITLGRVGEQLVHGELVASLRHLARFGLAIPVVLLMCAIGGALWDAAQRRRHRFVGYLMRGGMYAPFTIGAGLMAFTFADDKPLRAPILAAMIALIAVVGVAVGALVWVIDRARGRIPSPIEDEIP